MAGAKTSALGRVLTAVGVFWMAWSLFAGFFGLDRGAANLPFLPGLLFFFVGRALTKSGRRQSLPESVNPRQGQPGGTTPQAAETRSPRPMSRRESETRHEPAAETRVAVPEPDEPLPHLPDLDDEILELPPPMSSEEMVAEARRRFGPRPVERPGSDT